MIFFGLKHGWFMEGSYDGKNSHLVAFFIVRASLKEAFLPLPYRVQMAQYGLRFV